MANNSDQKSAVDADLVRQLAELLEETGLSEIEYGRDEWHIRVARGVANSVVHTSPMAAPVSAVAPSVAGPSEEAVHPGALTSPMVGVVYTSPDPDSADFVKVGDQVSEGDTLVLIEAMKVFNPIRSTRAGKVTKILVKSGTPVEFGEPLLIIE